MPINKQSPEFESLMQVVSVLRKHYSQVAGAAEREMIMAKLDGNMALAAKYKAQLDQIRDDHRAALEMIGNRLTSPEMINQTRSALRKAADRAFKFVEDLRKVRMTLEKLAEAANFLKELVGTLTIILG